MSNELIRGELYQITLGGIDWVADALYLGLREASPNRPRGHLVASRDSDGKGVVRGFTQFDFRGRVIVMKHAYKPELSDLEQEYVEKRLDRVGL